MNDILIRTSSHPYQVHIGENIRFQLRDYLTKKYASIMIITDSNVAKLYLEDIKGNFTDERVYEAIIPAGEQSKSIDAFYDLHTKAIQSGLNRESLIIALGGGVVGDLAGFVASTFMRGIDYIQVPTTILAHDSSVGGKVAINHALGKNLIGNFYPPQAVVYDVTTIDTLSEREFRSGYAELVKEALISDVDFFNALLATELKAVTSDALMKHLRAGIKIKADIVEADEREAGTRKFLNLGHTLAHALEAKLGYGVLTHGEAVAVGLLFAFRVSEKEFATTLPYDGLYTWLQENGYPLELPEISVDDLVTLMKSDKKVVNDDIQMVLISAVGNLQTVELTDADIRQQLSAFIGELVK